MPRLPHVPEKRIGVPYRVLAAILYGRFTWIERHADGAITANTIQFARQLGLRTHRLRSGLARLKELGYLDRLICHKGWFLARPACPPGLVRVVGAPAEPGPVVEDPVARVAGAWIDDAPATIDVPPGKETP